MIKHVTFVMVKDNEYIFEVNIQQSFVGLTAAE
jgi:hypothetical protein